MLEGESQRRRPKRRVSVNIQLSKQDLQEYLDDGYTAADIAKDFNVSPAIITEKIRKFGVRKTKQTKVVKKRGRPSSPKKEKRRGRPPGRQSPPTKERTNLKEQGTPTKEDLQNVVTQVIQDNPEEAVDHIHNLLSFMGFDLEKSVVEDRIRKWKGSSEPSQRRGQKSSKQDDSSKESCESGQQIRNETPGNDENEVDGGKTIVSEGVDVTAEQQTESISPQSQLTVQVNEGDDKEVASTSQKDEVNLENQERNNGKDGFDGENEPSVPEPMKNRRTGRPRKVHSSESLRTEPVKRRGPGRPRKICSNEAQKTESVSKRGPGRPRKKTLKTVPIKIRGPGRPRKIRSNEDPQMERVKRQRRKQSSKTNAEDTDANLNGSDVDNALEDSVSDEWIGDSKTTKRGRKRGQKRKTKTIKNGPSSKRGRPCLNLSVDNLKLCVDNGLPVGKIAEALGTCRQSVNRYLQVYKMRKIDRFSNLSNDELDKLVSEMCSEHPEWGQVRIQKELAKRGHYFRRAQVRNSVRRVDPVGIELRKLNNLKMRWNRGSLNRLDKILPADGINMTSTESFISQPPRNGLNGLKEEDSVRLLKSIVTTHKKTYVEQNTQQLVEQIQNPTMKEEPLGSMEEQSVLKDEQEKEIQGELMEAAQEVENSEDVMREVSEEISDQENIGPDSDHQHDLTIDSAQLSGSEDDKEYKYRQMLYNMVMSTNQKSERGVLSPTEGSEVNIPKEELEECVENGYSSSRIAEKFGTTITNVRKHLSLYKLAMSTRFEKITEERIDEIVTDVIREFSIKKGSEVYDYVRKKGFRIRKVDIHKSVYRLYPKGLHRKGSSIVQQSWEAASQPHPSDMECTVTQDEGQGNKMENDGVHETVVMLNSEELAQLINGEGSITLVEQQGSLSNRNEGGLVSHEQVTEISTSIANTFVTAGDVQQTVKPQEDEVSTIIVEIGLPGNDARGQVVDQMDVHGDNQMAQYDVTQHPPHEVVVVVTDEAGNREHIHNVAAVNTIPSNSEDVIVMDQSIGRPQ